MTHDLPPVVECLQVVECLDGPFFGQQESHADGGSERKMSVAARGENANGYLKMKIFFFLRRWR